MSLNPCAELVRVKTDLLGYINIEKDIDKSYEWGDVKEEYFPPKPSEIWDKTKYIRTTEYKHINNQWNNNEREILDDTDIELILKDGGLIYGMAGTGKSTTLNKIKQVLDNNLLIGAFTHKASKIVNGNTLHQLLGIDMKTNKYDYKLIKHYVKSGIKYFFIDEISMVPSWMWNILAHIKNEHSLIFIGCGDWKQLKPVEEEHINFKNSWVVKYLFNNLSFELTKVWRFNECELLQDAYKASNGDTINFKSYNNKEHPLALCHTNDAVNAINQHWNKLHATKHTKTKEVKGFDNTTYILYPGLKLMAYKTHSTYKFTNSQELTVDSWTDNTLNLKDTKGETLELEMKYTMSFKPRYAMTIYKAQGSTFTDNYSIYEYEDMRSDMLYVALTRARH